MADDVRSVPFESNATERRMRERRAFGSVTRVELAPARARLSWSGVWGGLVIGVGIWTTLAALGAAIGLSSVGPATDLTAVTISKATGGWLYGSALIGLFFGAAFGTRLAMVVDGAVAWFEATLIWSFGLVLATLLATTLVSLAALHPAGGGAAIAANPGAATPGALTAAWLTFVGIVIAWIVTVLGSFWGRAQAQGRAHSLGIAA